MRNKCKSEAGLCCCLKACRTQLEGQCTDTNLSQGGVLAAGALCLGLVGGRLHESAENLACSMVTYEEL
ncbi:unnamed protein product [Caretta caretta]